MRSLPDYDASIISLRSRVEHWPDGRLKLLTKMCQDKVVAHVGCVDHHSLLAERVASGNHLHQRLREVSARLYGFDVNEHGLRALSDVGFVDLHALDVTDSVALPNDIDPASIQVVVVGEVLEHLPNVDLFLTGLRDLFSGAGTSFIFTVPNCQSFRFLLRSFFDREVVNSDHRCWYSPYTIRYSLERAEFKVLSVVGADYERPGKLSARLLSLPARAVGRWSDSLVVSASAHR